MSGFDDAHRTDRQHGADRSDLRRQRRPAGRAAPRARPPPPAAPAAPPRAPPPPRPAPPARPPAPRRARPGRPARRSRARAAEPRPATAAQEPRGPEASAARAQEGDSDGPQRRGRRALPDREPPRIGRHVDRASRLRRAPRALRRREAARRAPRLRPRVRVALPARGARRGAADPPEHRAGLRLRPRRLPRPALHRDGVHRRSVVRRDPARPRLAADRGGPADHPRRLRRASTTPTARASCTATSSRATCCSDLDRTVKLADFGIAKATEQSSITQVGSVLGTAAYLAPGAGTRRGGRTAGRHLRAGRRHLPAALRPPSLRGRLADRARDQAAARAAAAPRRARRRRLAASWQAPSTSRCGSIRASATRPRSRWPMRSRRARGESRPDRARRSCRRTTRAPRP